MENLPLLLGVALALVLAALLMLVLARRSKPSPPAEALQDAPVRQAPLSEPPPPEEHAASQSPQFAMNSPVELWFGEQRVGIKAGSETHERFRSCADVLLGDLKAARGDSR